jgi:hypothetical protein
MVSYCGEAVERYPFSPRTGKEYGSTALAAPDTER